MLRVCLGTGKDPRCLANVSEALILASLLYTSGRVGMGQWHRLQRQGHSEHREKRYHAQVVGRIISKCSAPRIVSVSAIQGRRAKGE